MRLRLCLLLLLCYSFLGFAAPLPENQVFQFNFNVFDINTLKLDWTIKSGYFLYQDKIWVENEENKLIHIGSISFPAPETKLTKDGQSLSIYRDKLTLGVPILANSGGEFVVTMHYQGCSDAGFCYPPQHRDILLTFDKDHALSQARPMLDLDKPTIKPPKLITHPRSSNDVKTLFLTANPVWVLISFFGFGLLLAFTPCVLPMVPVLSSIIIGHGHTISTRKAFLLSLSYVLSMSVTYGVIGAVIAQLGANLQVVLQSSWALGGFSLIFVLLALSMFGVYEFRLPVSWQARLASVTRSHQGGHYLNAAIMGSMSILILSPCVTPPLIGALSYIAETGSAFLGLFALFFLGLGMGTPLLLIGASAGKLLPKAGRWMNGIKYIFGMILLGLAIHLLERLVAPFTNMLLWSALFIACGVGLKPFVSPTTGTAILKQALGCMLIIYGGFILFGANTGHTNPWHPLRSIEANNTLSKQIVTTLAEAQEVLAEAAESKQPVLVDFYATWCMSCQQIEKKVLQNPALLAYADRITIMQIDLSKNDADSRALLKYFNVIAPPTFLFYDRDGNILPDLQWVGEIDVDGLVTRVEKAVEPNSPAYVFAKP
ncbi:MAG: protein-disulfide reductase DsbD [Gammaproteobacteria bacterium]